MTLPLPQTIACVILATLTLLLALHLLFRWIGKENRGWGAKKTAVGEADSGGTTPSSYAERIKENWSRAALSIVVLVIVILILTIFGTNWIKNSSSTLWIGIGGLLVIVVFWVRGKNWSPDQPRKRLNWIALILCLTAIGSHVYKAKKDLVLRSWNEARATREKAAETRTVTPIKSLGGSKTVTAPVGKWSETITTPNDCWFQVRCHKNILAKSRSGKIRKAGPDHQTEWWGNMLNIADGTLEFRALGTEPAPVTVTWEPK